MYATTRDFVAALEKNGELARISAPISPILEITDLADRQSKSPAPTLPAETTRRTDPRFHHLGGKALLFENVEGSDIPVLINQFGSYRRMELALGCDASGACKVCPPPTCAQACAGQYGFKFTDNVCYPSNGGGSVVSATVSCDCGCKPGCSSCGSDGTCPDLGCGPGAPAPIAPCCDGSKACTSDACRVKDAGSVIV